MSPLYGDISHEVIGDIHSDKPAHVRDLANESQWEYGARSGSWRLMRCLDEYKTRATFFVCAQALERNPVLAEEIAKRDHDICGHGYQWKQQWQLSQTKEREIVRKTIDSVRKLTGKKIIGWFSKGGVGPQSRRIFRDEGLLYDCNAYNDDIPYFVNLDNKPWLILPYAFDANDMKYWSGGSTGWDNASSYLEYLKDSFDVLYAEGKSCAKMLSIGLHTRILGRPGRSIVLDRFIKYANQFPDVWFAGRDEIAHWWLENYSPK